MTLIGKFIFIRPILQTICTRLTEQWLTFLLYAVLRFSKHDQIGEVRIPLNTIDLAQTIEEWRNLTKVETNGGQVSYSSVISFWSCIR